MQIKGTDSRRRAIPFEPHELVHAAIVQGLKEHGGNDWIYWSPKDGLKLESPVIASKNPVDGTWEATAQGVCLIGKTKIATDQFYDAKRCSFKIAYKSAKDDLGLPDLKVLTFVFEFVETNPSKTTGPVPPKSVPVSPPVKGELVQEAAKPATKVEVKAEVKVEPAKKEPAVKQETKAETKTD